MDEYMITALEEARTGAREGGIPIGAVLVNARGTVVATGRNRRLQEGACVMHAEINCLLNAGQKLSSFRGMTMYSTLIPCNMCAGAIVHFGIIKVVYGESRNYRRTTVASSWSDRAPGQIWSRTGRPGPREGRADAQGLH